MAPSSSLVVALSLIATLVTSAYAQECFQLTGSQACPDLASHSVRAAKGQFSSVSEFDTYIMGQMNNNTNYITEFKNFYNCPGWEGKMQRFHMTVSCYFYVQMSNCPQSTPVVPLCKSSCTEYIDSLKSIFNNSTVCPIDNPDALKYRQLATGSAGYAPFCESLSADNSTTGACSSGMAMETANCGFFTSADGGEWCKNPANSDEACCVTMHNAALKGVSDSLLDTNNNVWIITGVSIGAAVILVICFILYIRARGWHKKTTRAVQPIVFTDSEKGEARKSKNRFTQRLSRSMGALFKPKGRVQDGSKSPKSFQSPSPFKNGGAPNDWENEPLPPMPNVTTIKKKNGGNNSLPRNKPEPEMRQQAQVKPAPMSVLSDGPPSSYMLNNAPPVPQSSKRPPAIDTFNGANTVVSYIPDTKFTLMKAMEEFFPSLDDEIQLQPGDRVQVVENFDDGWAVGKNLTSNEVGAFPLACLAPMETVVDATSHRKSEYRSRTHSLYAPRK